MQARIDNDDDRLREGMAFSVVLHFEGEEYPAIDPLSVQWWAEGSFVWAVRDGRHSRCRRDPPAQQRLRPGRSGSLDRRPVVTEGVQTLRPGSEVSVSNAAAPGDAGRRNLRPEQGLT